MQHEQKTYNIIQWTDLPREWKDYVSNRITGFHNDSMYEWDSEASDDLSVEGFRDWYNEISGDPCYADDFDSLETMVNYFGCHFEWYLANAIEFKNPKLPLLIDVCW